MYHHLHDEHYFVRYWNIYKFPFASATTPAPDVGNLANRRGSTGSYSSTHGYQAGGSAPATDTIDRFLFATEVDAVDHGDLYVGSDNNTGCSSSTHGYNYGDDTVGLKNQIQKFAYASNVTGTDVGNLTIDHMLSCGNIQY